MTHSETEKEREGGERERKRRGRERKRERRWGRRELMFDLLFLHRHLLGKRAIEAESEGRA